ncbi:MAG: methionyl-tRNA formyltransferase [Vampirovibrio sp.]|nr:methionyl-tRNA formyltransferase [Vampirovibrio sp.]
MTNNESKNPIRVVFMGTPAIALPAFQALLDASQIRVEAVFTQPDKPAGRGQKLTPPPVKVLAEENQLQVFQPVSLRKDQACLAWLKDQQPDFIVTLAFGQILSQEVLDIPKYGTVNVHASLLPEFRGPNPIQWAILQGKTETGLTTMLTALSVDSGPTLLQEVLPIGPDETMPSLAQRVGESAGPILVKTLMGVVDGSVLPKEQEHEKATHAPKLEKEDAFIDWAQPAQEIHNKIRGQQPSPGAATLLEGDRLKLIASTLSDLPEEIPSNSAGTILGTDRDGVLVQTGSGPLRLISVQPAGKKVMSARDWALGTFRDSEKTYQFAGLQPAAP